MNLGKRYCIFKCLNKASVKEIELITGTLPMPFILTPLKLLEEKFVGHYCRMTEP